MSWDSARAQAMQQRMLESQAIERNRAMGANRQPQFGGGRMYAGGDPNFDERTGQPVQRPAFDYMGGKPFGTRDWMPEPQGGDNYLQMLMKKYGGAAQGAYGQGRDWLMNRMPNANRQYMDARHRAIQNGMGDQ